jgi:hypothetical protein
MRKVMIGFLLVLIVPVLAGADLTIKEKTAVRAIMGVWTSEGTEVTYVKGDMCRNESEVERSGMVSPVPIKDPPPRVTIVRGDKGVMWRVNLKDRTYQEMDLKAIKEDEADIHRFKITDVKVEPTGETRQIAGHECKGVRTEITFEVDEGDEIISQGLYMVFWMAEDIEGMEEMKAFWDYSLELAQGQDQIMPVAEAFEKIWEESEELTGVPLGVDMEIEPLFDAERKAEIEKAMKEMAAAQAGGGEGEPTEEASPNMRISREVVSISTDKIDDSVFEIPDGFQKAGRIRIW